MWRTCIVHALPSTSEVKVNALHSSFCVCVRKQSPGIRTGHRRGNRAHPQPVLILLRDFRTRLVARAFGKRCCTQLGGGGEGASHLFIKRHTQHRRLVLEHLKHVYLTWETHVAVERVYTRHDDTLQPTQTTAVEHQSVRSAHAREQVTLGRHTSAPCIAIKRIPVTKCCCPNRDIRVHTQSTRLHTCQPAAHLGHMHRRCAREQRA